MARIPQRRGEAHDPPRYAALISALEGLSLELLAGEATAREVERAHTVLHRMVPRTPG